VTSRTLRGWRESKGKTYRMARKPARPPETAGEEATAYYGLVKMIPQREPNNRARRRRYGLLYLKIFEDVAGVLSPVTQRSRADHVGDGSDTRGTGPHGGR